MKISSERYLYPIIIGLLLVIIGLIIYISMTRPPVPDSTPIRSDSIYIERMAILNRKIDSLELNASIIIANIEFDKKIQLENQRKYYEDQIRRTKSIPADSALKLFAAYTSGQWGHRGGGSD